MSSGQKLRAALFIVLLAVIAGCSGEVTHYYLLSPSLAHPENASSPAAKRLGVWKVRMPEYLERTEIVRRRDNAELALNSLQRWGEPLSDTFSSVLASNLAGLCPTYFVTVLPAAYRPQIDIEFRTRVLAFERRGDKVELAAELGFGGKGGSLASQNRLRLERDCSGEEISSTVACMNAVLLDFSRQVAALPELNCPQ